MPASLLKSQFDTLQFPEDALIVNINNDIQAIVKNINDKMPAEIGLIGLGVMGTSLARNLARNGYSIALFNRRVPGIEERVAEKTIERYEEFTHAHGYEDLRAFVKGIERPRKIILMITAGKAVDKVIESLEGLLEEGDMILDGGNSFYKDTERRQELLSREGVHWIGVGISGGEEGALNGPSIMPGGSEAAVQEVLPFLQKIAAKNSKDEPCCAHIGLGASGHFVKMVHNGIEYGEMQLIAEIYDLLRHGNGLHPDEIANVFQEWNRGEINSYLLEITIDILRYKADDALLLDEIWDVARGKGTGSWTTATAVSFGVAVPTLTAALNARLISERKTKRVTLSKSIEWIDNQGVDLNKIKSSYELSRILNHIQGFDLIQKVSEINDWKIDRQQLASVWLNGCIIRSVLMKRIADVPSSEMLFQAFQNKINEGKIDLGETIAKAAVGGIAVPCIMASLSYLQGMSRAHSAANLIQAQRDYFGAHTYKRSDEPTGPSHHTTWKTE